jgi:excinuclease ABC subunit A
LIIDTLLPALRAKLHGAGDTPGVYRAIEGLHYLDKVIAIDQSPIGRTPRSNPATYTGVFAAIRELFASLPESKVRGYKAGRYSFNVKGGRCEVCQGEGIIRIAMHFLPDIHVQCDACGGRRYNRETLQVKYHNHTIAEVLNLSVLEALDLLQNIPPIRQKLETMRDVGLGYLKLGQPGNTLSGGESQRLKLSKELSRRATGRTLYILDEPTTGLHLADIHILLDVLHRLVEAGNTVLIIEHHLDVIKYADYLIDLGPEGGEAGGRIIATGTPEKVAQNPKSYTGKYLQSILAL